MIDAEMFPAIHEIIEEEMKDLPKKAYVIKRAGRSIKSLRNDPAIVNVLKDHTMLWIQLSVDYIYGDWTLFGNFNIEDFRMTKRDVFAEFVNRHIGKIGFNCIHATYKNEEKTAKYITPKVNFTTVSTENWNSYVDKLNEKREMMLAKKLAKKTLEDSAKPLTEKTYVQDEIKFE